MAQYSMDENTWKILEIMLVGMQTARADLGRKDYDKVEGLLGQFQEMLEEMLENPQVE